MTLFQLIAGFVRVHWRAYAASGCMLAGIALLGVWLPRQIGQMVDALVARQLGGTALWVEIGWLLAAGAGHLRPACGLAAASCMPPPTAWAWTCGCSCTSAWRSRARASTRASAPVT